VSSGPTTIAAPANVRRYAQLWRFALGLLIAAVIIGASAALRDALPWIDRWPRAWVIPIAKWISAFFDWLGYSADLGLFKFRDLTRGFSWLLGWPLKGAETLFFKGAPGYHFFALPWITVVGLMTIIGHHAGGRRTALIGGGCFLYLAMFHVWLPSLETFAIVAITAPFAALTGLGLGILAVRYRPFEALINPLFDVMQATPPFSYLVPVAVLFGFGQVPAMIATAIFAVPPMARCTILGLRTVPAAIIEAGRMAGCTPRQLLWKVRIPSARPTIMVGVNQAIMQTLAMVVIASLIGASGLGYNLLNSLEMLRLGEALEQGVAIVVIAVALDRLSQAYAHKGPVHVERSAPWWWRRPHLSLGLAYTAGTVLLAASWSPLRVPPEAWTVTTAPMWDALIEWITVHWYDPLQLLRNFLLLDILIPLRNLFLWFPWVGLVLPFGLLGWRLGGWKLALLVIALLGFPALTGLWKPAMITLYMISSAVVICIVVGFPIGLWAARSDRAGTVIMTVCDTMQTFPSFIYLIPVVMLFKVGDVAAIMAVLAFAVVPMIRYTNLGLRRVPVQTVEAAVAQGTTRFQRLWKVEMPIAFPELMLGVNQVIFMALFMVAITALVGTKDLGQQINRARSAADSGLALVAGLCIAFMGIAADRLISTWSRKRKQQLGIE